MKKKMLGVILTFVMLFTACTSPVENQNEGVSVGEVFEYYQTANDLIEGLRTVDMVNYLDIEIQIGGEEFSMPMTNKVTANTISNTEIEYAAAMIMPLDDGELVSETYYKDGYMYMNMYGEKFKSEVPAEDLIDEMLVSRALDFEEDAIRTHFMVDNENGEGKEIRMMLNGAIMTETLSQITAALRSQIDLEGLMEFTYSDVNLTLITDKEHRMKNFAFDFVMTFVIDGEEGSAIFKTTNEILATENITVNFPPDLALYTDMADFGLDFYMYDDEYYEDEYYEGDEQGEQNQ